MDIEKALGLTGIEYIKRCRQARTDGTVVKIAGIGFLPEEAELMYQKNLYIVTYRKIFAVCYHAILRTNQHPRKLHSFSPKNSHTRNALVHARS